MAKLSSMKIVLHTESLFHEVAIAITKGISQEGYLPCEMIFPHADDDT